MGTFIENINLLAHAIDGQLDAVRKVILKGNTVPTDSQGEDGDKYMLYGNDIKSYKEYTKVAGHWEILLDEAHEFLRSDGTKLMDANYVPKLDRQIITKAWADRQNENLHTYIKSIDDLINGKDGVSDDIIKLIKELSIEDKLGENLDTLIDAGHFEVGSISGLADGTLELPNENSRGILHVLRYGPDLVQSLQDINSGSIFYRSYDVSSGIFSRWTGLDVKQFLDNLSTRCDNLAKTKRDVGVQIETDDIKDENITTVKLRDLAVTTEKINDKAVTAEKLDNGSVTGGESKGKAKGALGLLAVHDVNIKDDAVIERTILDQAVTTRKIKDKAVTKGKILEGAVEGGIDANDKPKFGIAFRTIVAKNIAEKTITDAELDDEITKILNSAPKMNNTDLFGEVTVEDLLDDKDALTTPSSLTIDNSSQQLPTEVPRQMRMSFDTNGEFILTYGNDKISIADDANKLLMTNGSIKYNTEELATEAHVKTETDAIDKVIVDLKDVYMALHADTAANGYPVDNSNIAVIDKSNAWNKPQIQKVVDAPGASNAFVLDLDKASSFTLGLISGPFTISFIGGKLGQAGYVHLNCGSHVGTMSGKWVFENAVPPVMSKSTVLSYVCHQETPFVEISVTSLANLGV